jgi:hypothetical protein
MTPVRGALILALATSAIAATPAIAQKSAAAAEPTIRDMKLRTTGHGPPGGDYFVRVHVRLRVCAVRGRSQAMLHETLRIGGQTFGEHSRTIAFRQRSQCETHRFRWRLRDEFLGVGTYRVAATVRDRDAQVSNTVSRKQTTVD